MKVTLRKCGILLATLLSVAFSFNYSNAQITGTSTVCVNGTTTLVAPSTSITGGTITNVNGYNVHTFSSAGTFFIPTGLNINAELLVVAGGGGGGYRHGGGGGAGGLIYNVSSTITGSQAVVIGAGGIGGYSDPINGANGGNSSFGSFIAIGGGGGGTNNINANSGGSGGGGSNGSFGGAGTAGQGNAGGNQNNGLGCCNPFGAGGGGYTAAGASTLPAVGSVGGAGFTTSMTGSSLSFAGGGGGGSNLTTNYAGGIGGGGLGANALNMTGGNGTPNTGGGGGGGGANGGTSGVGGVGGSGIVIVKYAQAVGTWTSSNTAVATVNASTGVVTGVSAGSATITYSVTVGGVVNNFTKVITSGTPTINITSATPAVCAGATATLVANSGGGNAVRFNGTNSYIDLGTGVILPTTFTQEAWIYSGSGNDGQFHGFIGNQIGGSSFTRPPSMWIHNGTEIHGGFGDGVGFYYYITAPGLIQQNTWNHIAQTFDGTTLKCYVNGVLASNATYVTPAGKTPIANPVKNIGRVDNYFNGDIDEVRMWNITLTQAQIQANMNKGIPTSTTGLVSYWKMEEGTGTTTADSKTGLSGSFVNGPTWTVSSAPIGATITWSPSTGLNTTTGPIALATPASTTIYIATATDATFGCTAIASTTVTVNPLPTATVSGATNVCINTGSPLVTFTGATGTAPYTFTYTINGGAQQTVTSTGNTATVSAPTNVAGTFTYTLVSVKDASTTTCSNTITGSSIVVVVRAIPTISSVTGTTSICAGNSTTLTAASAFIGAQYKWYDAATGGNLLASGATYTTAVLSNTTNYYVELTAAPNVCAATRTPVTVTVNPLPTATISAIGSTSVCPGSTVSLQANAGTGFTYQWSKDAVSISGATAATYNATATGSYTVVITNSNGCVSAVSNAIAVTVSDNIAPVFTTTQPNITATATSASGAVVIYTLPTATDNCTITPTVTAVPVSGSLFPIGTTIVTVTATDATGNSTNTTFNIIVSGTAPVITVPANSTLNATSGQCTATANFAATETTGIPSSTIAYSENGSPISSGTALSVGVHTITATATNAVGASSGIFTVTVKDIQAPTFSGNTSNAPASILANVPEAAQYKMVYQLNVPNAAQWSSQAQIPYTVNNAASLAGASFTRIAYYMELDNGKWVWVSMDKFTNDPSLIGIPTGANIWQQKVNNMNVFASANAGVTTGTNIATGNIEIWSHCYNTPNGLGLPGANASTYDFDDLPASQNCYGSFQVHNYGAKQTLLAYNRFAGGGNSDIGIGNGTGQHPDWTFMQNAAGFTNKKIYVFISGGVIADINANTDLGLCSATVNVPTPTATDLCGNTTVTGVRSDALALTAAYPKGTTTITWTATDASSNSTTTSQKIIVADNEAPVIAGPSNINVTATSAAGALVNYATPTATDNCPTVTIAKTAGLASGSTFPIGVSTITYKATDAAGLTASYTFTVTVAGVAPAIVVPANIVKNTAVGLCSASVTFAATETTGVPASTITYKENAVTVISGSAFSVGVHTITATATNAVGSSTKTFTITVNDVTPPVFTSTASIITSNIAGVVQATSANGAVVMYSMPSATDNCTGSPSVVAVPASGSVFPIGNTTVTVTATDNSGNSTQTSFVVTVAGLAPVIVVPSTITISNTAGLCSAVVSFAATETTGIPASTITYDIQPGSVFNVGTTKVTATATNVIGSTSKSFDVVVKDTELPIVQTKDVTVYLDAQGTASVTAAQVNNNSTDNCGIASLSVSPNTFNCSNITKSVLAYSGSATNGVQNYTGTLGMDFYVVNPSGILISQLGAFDDGANGIFGTQDGGSIRVAIFDRNTASIVPGLDVFIAGTSDPLVSNHRMHTITPVVLPVGNYSIVALGYNSAELNGNAGFYGYPPSNTNDNDGAIVFTGGARAGSTLFDLPGSLDTGPASRYHAGTFTYSNGNAGNTVVLSVTDIHGNTGIATAKVTVVDAIAPTITCQDNVSVVATSGDGAVVNYTAPVGNDNCSATTTLVAGLSSGSVFPIGTTIVTYSAVDPSGNRTDCSFTVTVTGIAPVLEKPADINLPNDAGVCGANVYFVANETAAIPAATIEYTEDGMGVYPGGFFGVGTHHITVTATNDFGSSSVDFTITINDNEKPFIRKAFDWGREGGTAEPGKCGTSNIASLHLGVPGTASTFQAFDNCSIASITSNAPTFFPVGVTIVTYTVTDIHGNFSTIDEEVTVSDFEPPVIASVADINVNATSAAGAVVNYTAPIGTDNCSAATTVMTAGLASGSTFPIGTTVVTYTVTDAAGLTASTSFNVIVTGLAPVIVTPGDIIVNNDPGKNGAIVSFAATETTAIPASTITYTIAPGTFFTVGTTKVTATATNAVGSTSVSFNVIVIDNEKPTIATAADIAVNNDANACAAIVATTAPAASDNTSIASVTGVRADGLLLTDAYPVGTTVITWTATDIYGNTNSSTESIVVTDNQLPTITASLNVTITADAGLCSSSKVNLGTPVTADNCGVASFTSDAQATYPVGTTTVTWTVTDIHGNKSTATQTVTVTDDELPVIVNTPINITQVNDKGNCGAVVTWTAATATDNCPGVTISADHQSGETFPVGTTTVTYTAIDAHGHTVTSSFSITVNDTELPTITTTDKTQTADAGVCKATVTVAAPITADNCAVQSVTNSINGTSNACGVYPVGTTQITWTVTDIHGNTNTTVQNITVNDDEKPIAKTQNITIQLNASGVANITAAQINNGSTDNCGVASITLDKSSFYCSNVGVNTVTLTVTDIHGNVSTATATVTVQDKVAPVARAKNITLGLGTQVGGLVTITAADVNNGSSDACGIASMTVVPASFGCSNVGANTVTLTVTDVNGNVSTTTAIVTVVDDKGPVPTITNLPTINGQCYATALTLKKGEDGGMDDGKLELDHYYLVVPTAMDNCTGLAKGTTTDALTYYNQGEYIIHWKYVDAKGNVTIQEQKVIVKDTEAPTPKRATLPTLTGQCSVNVVSGTDNDDDGDDNNGGDDDHGKTPWAFDNCSGWIKGTTTSPLTYTLQGTYTIVWDFNDGHGNISHQLQTVIVKDVTAPRAVAENLPTITGQCSASVTTAPTALDNCVGTVTGTTTDPLTYNAPGTYTIHWTYSDGRGNTSTQNQQVVVRDNIKPIITVPANVTGLCVGVSTDPSATGTATATDNCSGTVTVTYTDQKSGSSINRTWKATDASGNTATAVQQIGFSAAYTASITSVPTSKVNTGGSSTSLFLGYGAQSTALTVTGLPSSGAPYTYQWTGLALGSLNSATAAAPVFAATAAGNYQFSVTVTNKNGCTAFASINICVKDVRVSGSNGTKVYVCHQGNGKSTSAQTLEVLISQVASHLNGSCGSRGTDILGSCNQGSCDPVVPVVTSTDPIAKDVIEVKSMKSDVATAVPAEDLKVTVMPNPSTTYFTLKFETKDQKTPMSLRVMDASGRAIDSKQQIDPSSTIQIGHNYPSGTFYTEVMQGNKRKVVQLIKARG